MNVFRKDNLISWKETRTKICLLASFLLPVVVLLLVAYKFKLYPFTSNCLITESMQETYLPVVTELRRKLFARESLFYTWNVGGGANFWAWIGAYAMSPFTLIYLLFPVSRIAQATEIIFVLKAATASLCLFLMLWKKENVVSPISVGLSTAYGLSAYVLTYSQQPWILDTVILLPLLILTLHQLILGKRNWAFAITCALVGITCCQAGIYMLFFVVAIFPLLYLQARFDGKELPKLSEIIKYFFIYLCIGVALSAIVWVPYIRALGQTVPGHQTLDIFEDLKADIKTWDFIERAAFSPSLIFPSDSVQDPSVYCGIFTIILAILYGLSSKIRFTEKLYSYCAIVVIYGTIAFRPTRFIMNGFHYSIEGEFPQTILISFLLVFIAGRLLSRGILFENRNQLWFAAGLLATFMTLRAAISDTASYASFAVYMAIALLIIYFASTYKLHTSKSNETPFWMAVIALAMVVESGLSFYGPIKEKYWHQVAQRNMLFADTSEGFELTPETIEEVKNNRVYQIDNSVLYKESDPSKTELLRSKSTFGQNGSFMLVEDQTSDNYGLLYGIPSLSSDSYLTPKRYSEVLRMLGINKNTDGTKIIPRSGTRITDLFLNLWTSKAENITAAEKELAESLYSNGYFLTTPNVFEDIFVSDDPFVVQNNLAYQLASVKPFTKMRMETIDTDNISQSDDGSFRAIEKDKRAVIELESEDFLSSTNIPIYICCTSSCAVGIDVELEDIEGNVKVIDRKSNVSGAIINVTNGETINRRLRVVVSISMTDDKDFKVSVVTADREKLSWMEEMMKNNAFSITSHKTDSMEGTINATSSGEVVWGIPFDSGWSVSVDGKRTYTFAAYKAFLGIHIPTGTHEIKLTYTTPGFVLGACVSTGALLMMSFLAVMSKLPKKKKEEETKEEKEDEKA
ncbi:MAG: YfhO family protein [Clostridiales bacterium]|nr:YfhO family protein [Clostridiales bacterium]